MVNVETVINLLIAQAPLVSIAVTVLYYTLDKKIERMKAELERKIESLDRKIERVKEELNREIKNVQEELHKKIDGVKEEVGREVEGVKEGLSREIEGVRGGLERVRERVEEAVNAFYSYENTLIDFLAVKGVVAESEAVLLRGALRSLVPLAKSKYYTEEVRKRLIELLDKEIGDYTWSDIDELEKIAEAIRKEAWETGREDLRKYYPLLMMYTAMLRGILRRREIEKRRSDREKPQD